MNTIIPPKKFINWDELLSLIKNSAKEIASANKDIDTIVALSRGGLIPARIIAQELNIKHVYSFGINFYDRNDKLKKVPDIYQPLPESFWSSNILIIDDIIDSGNSIKHVCNYIQRRYCSDNNPLIYTIFYKSKQGLKPHFYSQEIKDDIWVIFPWESE